MRYKYTGKFRCRRVSKCTQEQPTYLIRHNDRADIFPGVQQFDEHFHWSATRDLAQATKDTQLLVGHTHVLFVRLGVVSGRSILDWTQFGL